MFSCGLVFFGLDFGVVDYDQITDLSVSVNPVEKILGAGTVSIYTGHSGQGSELLRKMISIDDPYAGVRKLKTISMDVKKDIYFPNERR